MLISVALCTYNGARFISEQLQSIIDQDLRPDEIVICDDGSTDDTIAIIKKFQEQYSKLIQLHINEQNLRTNKNFEKALTLCQGDFIFFSDQDDVWKKNKTQAILAEFEQNPVLEGVFSNADLITDTGEKTARGSLWENVQFMDEYIHGKVDLYYYITTLKNMVTGAALCIRSQAKHFVMPFPGHTAMFHDEWIGLCLGHRKTLGFTKQHLFSYRVHAAQQIGVIKPASLAKHVSVIKNILGIEIKEGFTDLLQVRKSYWRNYTKFSKLRNGGIVVSNFPLDVIIEKNKSAILLIESRMKRSHMLLFWAHKIADKIAGKRQLKS